MQRGRGESSPTAHTGTMSPNRSFRKVVFPAPLAPTTQVYEPHGIVQLTPRSTAVALSEYLRRKKSQTQRIILDATMPNSGRDHHKINAAFDSHALTAFDHSVARKQICEAQHKLSRQQRGEPCMNCNKRRVFQISFPRPNPIFFWGGGAPIPQIGERGFLLPSRAHPVP